MTISGLGKCPLCWKQIEEMTPVNNVMLGRPPRAWVCHQECKTRWLAEQGEPVLEYVKGPTPIMALPQIDVPIEELPEGIPFSIPAEASAPTPSDSSATERPLSESSDLPEPTDTITPETATLSSTPILNTPPPSSPPTESSGDTTETEPTPETTPVSDPNASSEGSESASPPETTTTPPSTPPTSPTTPKKAPAKKAVSKKAAI